MKDIPVSALLSIIFGVIIFLVPTLAAYFVGAYLIIAGVMAIKKR